MPTRLTHDDFLARVKQVHGDRFDYGKTLFVSTKGKITITCPLHGEYHQAAGSHLRGVNCPSCGGKKNSQKYIATQGEKFLVKAKLVHGGKYGYELANYTAGRNKLTIRCPEHGAFTQEASSHLQGHGCPACKKLSLRETKAATADEFVAKAKLVHGATYGYQDVVYLNSGTKVSITCGTHGAFQQTPDNHLAGKGCIRCRDERVSEAWATRYQGLPCQLYFLRLFRDGEEFYKVGITHKDIESRYKQKSDLGGYQMEVLAVHRSTNARAVWDWEQSILHTFRRLKYLPQLPFGGASECFSLADPILEIFPL